MILLTDLPAPACDHDLELDGITLHIDIEHDDGGSGLAPMSYPVLRGATLFDIDKLGDAYGEEAATEAFHDAEDWAEHEFFQDMDKVIELVLMVDAERY